ncbi:MAG: aminotransferase class III-fold pyridoxal phosphate-dependent enzyme, partial [Candidatus Binataceae bacterium]
KEYWPRIADICKRHDILLIADEVMTGFGRTGKRFAVEHWDLKPDILIGGKGLTGGYMPMGMMAVDERLVEESEKANADFMFYTYSCHPLACAIADKVLEIMERERLVERAAEVGAKLGAQLKEELSGHPMVGDIRGTGLFWGIELVRDQKERTPFVPALKVTSKVLSAALRHGLFIYPSVGMAGKAGGDGVLITPPFTIDQSEVDYIVQNLRTALDEVQPTL